MMLSKETRTQRNSSLGLVIDPDHEHLLDEHTFVIDHNGYVRTYINHKSVRLHHLVAGKPPAGKITDHINGDKLDNRRSNLRFVNSSESNKNRRPYGKTGIKHVIARGGSYRGSLTHNGKTVSFPARKTATEAAQDVSKFKKELV